jgi:hypothetical protein
MIVAIKPNKFTIKLDIQERKNEKKRKKFGVKDLAFFVALSDITIGMSKTLFNKFISKRK